MKFESGEESGEEKSEKMRGMCGETCDWDRERHVFIVFLLKDVRRLSNGFLIKRCECQWLRERETCGEEKKVKNAAVSISEKIRKHLFFLDSFIWSHSFYII